MSTRIINIINTSVSCFTAIAIGACQGTKRTAQRYAKKGYKLVWSDAFNSDGQVDSTTWQPHYMLLNLAICGMNGGDPAGTISPNRFEVDYVRVYQKSLSAGAELC